MSLWHGGVLKNHPIGSNEWDNFMSRGDSFSVIYWSGLSGRIKYTVMPEKRGDRLYWRATKTVHKKIYRKYIGAKITREKLTQTGEYYQNLVEGIEQKDGDQRQLLENTIKDLESLVRDLLPQARNPDRAKKARQDLEKIMQRLNESGRVQ